jgi:AraC-like DNA-binding protein/Tfp pilus assembly protein PilF
VCVTHSAVELGRLREIAIRKVDSENVPLSGLRRAPNARGERPTAVVPRDVKLAIDHMRRHADGPICVADVARAAGVPRRTLQQHFRRFVGQSLTAYLLHLRLERARSELLRSPSGANVTAIALRHGFAHLGRFSDTYRRTYGEAPSATLRRGRFVPLRGGGSPHASAVAALLAPEKWAADLARARRHRPDNPEACELAMRALPLASVGERGAVAQALDLASEAALRDPEYALPPALAAWCHAQRVVYTWTSVPEVEREEAMRLAREAARHDIGDATVRTVLGAAQAVIGQLDDAARHISAALALDPRSPWAWQRSAWMHTYAGDVTAAIAEFRRALHLNPDAPQTFNTYIGLGVAEFEAGNYHHAAAWVRLGLRASPAALWSHRILAAAAARSGHKDEAHWSAATLRRAQPALSIGQIVATFPANPNFLDRLADGLATAGVPI